MSDNKSLYSVTPATIVSDAKKVAETRSEEDYQKSLERLSNMFSSMFMDFDFED